MSKEKKDNPGNPGHYVSPELCEAFRNVLLAEIKGIRNTIIVGLSISTMVVTLTMYLLNVGSI